MKKYLIIIIIVFSFAAVPIFKASALVYEVSPESDPDHFVWALMADMQTPDDHDCSTLAHAMLDADGTIPEGAHSEITTAACDGLASMRTNMEADMNAGGAVETNLWDAANWHSIENLYFQHSTNGVADGRISFSVPIDFMSYNFMRFMQTFGQNMESREGYISLDADLVGGFANYGASLTMYNIPKFNEPEIFVDGEEDSGGIVSNLVYNREANTITFSAAHFSSFEVTESDEKPDVDKVKVKKYFDRVANKWKVSLIAKGNHFDRDTEVTLGGRAAYKIKYKSHNRIIARFSLDKLIRSGRNSLILRVINGDETETFNTKLKISELTENYQNL